MIDKILLAIFIVAVILLFYFIANFIFKRLIKNKVSKRKETIFFLIISVAKYTGLLIGLFVILTIFGIDTASVLAGASLLGILLGFALQKLMQDMISGFFIIFENQYVVGEYVAINLIIGEVLELGLKTTKILTYEGEIHFFANGDIKSVVNYSRNYSLVVIDLPILHEYQFSFVNRILEEVVNSFYHESALETPRIKGVQTIDELCYWVRIVCITKSFENFDVSRMLKTKIVEKLKEKEVKYVDLTIIKR